MVSVDSAHRSPERALRTRLLDLQRATGLPVVFGGAVPGGTREGRFAITAQVGTISDALSGLVIRRGRGLGGTALERGVPCRVDDYAAARAITHDYDTMVAEEKLTSIFAFPVRVDGEVRSVLYGAVRSGDPIGDRTLRQAGLIASQLQADLRSAPAAGPAPGDDGAGDGTRRALVELADIIAGTSDARLRERLARIHREFSGAPGAPESTDPTADGPERLTRREADVLRLVALGASNSEIADQLNLSVQTVKAYLRSAMRKLKVRNRTAAVHVGRAAGLF
ncbi:LuxR C-terminal-related transcriptional regulator [Pseudonocardia kujensis]|uniref:LuxR C-terminal-related transcriptional regulator n=1 Tax=Pseudonocardia kujensis TaxID=1128675 RepID=UPI001E60B027|nr:LuxR C-terminal-related transcriptional regulator [Pseudonocardia kujensis]MCE0767976.1 LuxR C-terminal-related transcriptional regulator [Pseudonocardia kujensis]